MKNKYVIMSRDNGEFVKDTINNTKDIEDSRKFDTHQKALNFMNNYGINVYTNDIIRISEIKEKEDENEHR